MFKCNVSASHTAVGVRVKCPYCDKNPVIYDWTLNIYVCSHCGSVIDDRPIVDCDEDYERPEVLLIKPVTIKQRRGRWLAPAVEAVNSMYKRVFWDECTLKTAISMLHDLSRRIKKITLIEDYDALARFSILVSSRKCREPIALEKLFPSQHALTRLMNRYPQLVELYEPINLRDELVKNIVALTECLELENKDKILELAKIISDKIPIYTKPSTQAEAIVYYAIKKQGQKITRKLIEKIAKCMNKTPGGVRSTLARNMRNIQKYINLVNN